MGKVTSKLDITADETTTEDEVTETSETEDDELEESEESSETEEKSEETPEEEDEVVVTIGEESPPTKEEPAPEWVRELRKTQRELVAENKKLKAENEAIKAPPKPVETLGKKPTLQDPDIDYDTEKFETALTSWYDKKREVDRRAKEAQDEEKAQKEAWQKKLDGYAKGKTELKVKDYDEAEAAVQEVLDVTQQGVLLDGSDNPALLVYALGKNDKRLKELSTIKNPVKFAFAVAKLEAQLKVSGRKTPPPPEKVVTSTGTKTSGTSDSTLERLRTQAEKSGDYTKVNEYKRKLRASGKK